MSSVQGCKIIWCLLSTVAKLSGVFCPQWQKNVASFVHPGKKVWCLLFTLAKNAWCLLGLVSFVRLPLYVVPLEYNHLWGAPRLSGRVSDSGPRGQGLEIYHRRVVSLSNLLPESTGNTQEAVVPSRHD